MCVCVCVSTLFQIQYIIESFNDCLSTPPPAPGLLRTATRHLLINARKLHHSSLANAAASLLCKALSPPLGSRRNWQVE